MVRMPTPSITELINDAIEKQYTSEWPRDYIGYSELGGKCKRKIWYNFRWVKKRVTSARMIRLFARGDWEESRIIRDMESIGCTFHSEQKEVIGYAEHVKGHIDGIFENVPNIDCPVLAEFKTANDKRFKDFLKLGCKLAEPGYYSQAQSYMGHLDLKKCLFFVTNKNDERRYIEIIDFDEDEFRNLESIAFSVLTTDQPLPKIGDSTWYECKFCDARKICHYNGDIMVTCRTCVNGAIEDHGIWTCELNNRELSVEDQRNACEHYKLLEGL